MATDVLVDEVKLRLFALDLRRVPQLDETIAASIVAADVELTYLNKGLDVDSAVYHEAVIACATADFASNYMEASGINTLSASRTGLEKIVARYQEKADKWRAHVTSKYKAKVSPIVGSN